MFIQMLLIQLRESEHNAYLLTRALEDAEDRACELSAQLDDRTRDTLRLAECVKDAEVLLRCRAHEVQLERSIERAKLWAALDVNSQQRRDLGRMASVCTDFEGALDDARKELRVTRGELSLLQKLHATCSETQVAAMHERVF